MNTNDILCEIHASVVKKVRERCRLEGSNKAAIEIADAMISYGKMWSESFANDGIIDDTEEKNICAEGAALIRNRIPSIDNSGVKIAWNGLSLFGIGWVGLKAKLKDWFGLTFACLAVCLCLCGCRESGVYAAVGDLNAPVDLSDASDSVTARVLFSMNGAKVWTRRDSAVKMKYRNVYTNTYIGCIQKYGVQDFDVRVDPVETTSNEDVKNGIIHASGTEAVIQPQKEAKKEE